MKVSELGMLPGYIAQGVFAILIIALTQSSVMASTTAETEFTANIQSATCTLSGPTTYNIGPIATITGTKGFSVPFPTFQLVITCNGGNLVSGLYARMTQGTLDDPKRIAMGNKKDIIMSLSGNNHSIYLDSSTSFCNGEGSRDCIIEPFISLRETDDLGDFSASVAFTLKYS
ncbi:TPA: hypothetical protein KJD73_003954 [Escherichia coli]|nr:hypothetical protein [Escherichia coli]